jgi:hypothetical protein
MTAFGAFEAVQLLFDPALQILGTGACRPGAGEAVPIKAGSETTIDKN